MNKNPFVPQPSYSSQQPPLPPGPPPPQPSQPDYAAYWAAAAALQHQQPSHVQQQAPSVGAYNSQWAPPQPQPPPRPPPEQSALYANYGYGGQQGAHWQQQQRHSLQQLHQQHYHQPPPPPIVQPPPPPPPQPAYNPYQPTAGYPQPYVPQAPSQSIPIQPSYNHPPPPPQQQNFYPRLQQPQVQPQPQQSSSRHNIHHIPSQQLPPAKRQRFEGPSHGQSQNRPPQPQYQPPPPPSSGMYPTGPSAGSGHGRGGSPSGPGHPSIGSGQGRGGAGRGGLGRGRGGGSMGGGGGGGRPLAGGRMRGNGSMYLGGSGGGSGGRGGSANALRTHGSRGGFSNHKDYHSRRGGSFNSGGASYHNSSFRRQGNTHSRGGRHDGAQPIHGTRDGSTTMNSGNFGRKDENRRTLTDFKIVGLEIRKLDWTWGLIPESRLAKEKEADSVDLPESLEEKSNVPQKSEAEDADVIVKSETSVTKTDTADSTELKAKTLDHSPSETTAGSSSIFATPPPSRIRIYFHTPVSPDDFHPIPHATSFTHGTAPSDSRKGKRKKSETDDGDLEDGRRPPPPPQMGNAMSDDRSSVIASAPPSVADTVPSESDWLMAAIVESDQADLDADGEDDEDGDQLHVSQIVGIHDSELTTDDIGDGSKNGPHSIDVKLNGDVNRDPTTAGSDSPESGVDGNVSAASKKAGETQDVAVVTGDIPADGVGDTITAPDLSALDTADADSTASSAASPVAAISTEVGENTSSHEFENTSGVAQIDEESLRAPAPSTSHDSHVEDMPTSVTEQAADNDDGYSDSQLPTQTGTKPLMASYSLASTVPDFDSEEVPGFPDDVTVSTNGNTQIFDHPTGEELNLLGEDGTLDNPTEPPKSPTPLPSMSSLSNHDEKTTFKVDGQGPRTPSANRVSISYAGGSRRLVIDAEVVDTFKLFRREGRIEIHVNIDKMEEHDLKGILIEGLSDPTKSYAPLQILSEVLESDPTLPPFSKLEMPSSLDIVIHLDTERPLSEPKWAKTGDVQDWLKSMFGRMFWVAGDAAEGWEKKISVVDPDPPPTIWTVLDGWAVNSPVGQHSERQRFLKTHMTEADNILEILLRLVRGERATPFAPTGPALSAPNVSGPLLSALAPGSAHGAQQTHVSLAVLAMYRLAGEYARKVVGEKGQAEVDDRMGEIVRCLPSHLIYKSLDGIFKEWRAEKKGR